MKIVFVSNFMSHHQLAICERFLEKSEFKFIATEPFNQSQVSVGYEDMNEKYNFILRSYQSDEIFQECVDRINNADLVIFGSCPFSMVRERIINNKLTFKYSERLFKNHKFIRMFHPGYIKKIKSECSAYKNNNYYLLCSSAYAAKDYSWYGAFKHKCMKWGYFPKIQELDKLQTIIANKNKYNNILWCGRFVKFKHPEYAIQCAQYLRNKNVDFKLTMIGDGSMKSKIESLIKKYNLQNYVFLAGAISFDKVQEEMRKAKVFLFTSDQNEGWGAVLNESMGNACCVIANNQIGSVPYLINNNKNGYVYKTKKELLDIVLNVCNNEQEQICAEAYKTIHEVWNSKNAVDLLMKRTEELLNKQVEPCDWI